MFQVSASSCAKDNRMKIRNIIFEKYRIGKLNLIIVFKTKNPTKVRSFVYRVNFIVLL